MKAQRVIMETRIASDVERRPMLIFSRISLCQASGPSNSAKAPSSDQGNAPRTNARGSSLTKASQAISLGSIRIAYQNRIAIIKIVPQIIAVQITQASGDVKLMIPPGGRIAGDRVVVPSQYFHDHSSTTLPRRWLDAG